MVTESEQEPSPSFVGDLPLDEPEQDRFRRWPFAQRIAETIAARRDPANIVIGIYGKWGEGKTTVLNFVEKALSDHRDVVTVRFNPWRYEDELHLLNAFFVTLADALDRSLSTGKEKFGEVLKKYGGALKVVPVGGLGDAAQDLGQALSDADLETLKKRVERFPEKAGKRVVIFMDDIDRLDKSEIHAVFRLVKLSADFRFVTYVLAFDQHMVAATLQERYPSCDTGTGHSFLEKIIQVPLNLPAARQSELVQIGLEGVYEAVRIAGIQLEEDQEHRFLPSFYDGLSIRLMTPRMVKRYANALVFALPILKGEVDPVDLMLIEGLRVFYPNVYRNILGNREAYLCSEQTGFGPTDDRIAKEYEKARSNGVQDLTPTEKQAAERVIEALFPLTGRVAYSHDWGQKWEEEKRIASTRYFDRYFSYAVPEGDVPDVEIEKLLACLEQEDAGDVTSRWVNLLVDDKSAEAAIRKVRQRASELLPMASRKLAICVVGAGDRYPDPEISLTDTPFSQAAGLLYRLIMNLPQEERYTLAERIIALAHPVGFRLQCASWLHSPQDIADEDRVLTQEEEERLYKGLAQWIKELAEEGPFYIREPRHAERLFYWWAEDNRNEVRKYLTERLRQHPDEIVSFLKAYLPAAWPRKRWSWPHQGDFERRQYEKVAELVDPNLVDSLLVELYGPEIQVLEYDHVRDSEDVTDELLARQFYYIHQVVQKQSEAAPNEEQSG